MSEKVSYIEAYEAKNEPIMRYIASKWIWGRWNELYWADWAKNEPRCDILRPKWIKTHI